MNLENQVHAQTEIREMITMLEQQKSDAEALQMCLSFLGEDAAALDLPFVRMLIGLAVEELDRVLAERPRH